MAGLRGEIIVDSDFGNYPIDKEDLTNLPLGPGSKRVVDAIRALLETVESLEGAVITLKFSLNGDSPPNYYWDFTVEGYFTPSEKGK